MSCLTSGGSYLHVTAEPGFYPRERFGGVAAGWGAAAGAAGLTHSCPGETEEHPDRRSPHLLNQLPPGFLEGAGGNPVLHANAAGLSGKCDVFLHRAASRTGL